jgi:hypothetical protein
MKKASNLESRLKRLIRQEESSHQKVIKRLTKRIKKSNPDSKIFTNIYYQNAQQNEDGEFDLLALIGFYNNCRRYALIFEVKSSKDYKSKKKAISQLEKNVREVKSFYEENIRCFCFSVYTSNNYFRNKKWNSKPYKLEWIRKNEL